MLAGLLGRGTAHGQNGHGALVVWGAPVVGVDLSAGFAAPLTQMEAETCEGS